MQIGFLIYPDFTLLDMAGAAEPLGLIPGARLHMVWKSLDPVTTDQGVVISPSTTFADCPQLDVLCVPGGIGQMPHVLDPEMQRFLQGQEKSTTWLSSICTGSFFLAAAGLLQGYRTARHWAFKYRLDEFGAIATDDRIVRDRNRLSGAGVTAGVDLGIALAAEIAGEETARIIELTIEYDPQPPFGCGHPRKATQAESVAACHALSTKLPPEFEIDAKRAIAANNGGGVA